jgi:hypothetical protein
MNRRGFLGAILAAGAAPAIIQAENAMRLWVPRQTLITGEIGWVNGFRFIASDIYKQDAASAMAQMIDNQVVSALPETLKGAWRLLDDYGVPESSRFVVVKPSLLPVLRAAKLVP